MQIGLYQSVSGLKAMEAYQANLAANLSRQAVVGARSVSTAFEVYDEQPSQTKAMLGKDRPVGIHALPIQPQTVVNFSQGTLQRTDRPTDFAIQGQAFFAVQEQNAEGKTVTTYTRDGQFHINSQGNVVTADGAQVMLDSGPFKIVPGARDNKISVLQSGTVYVGGSTNPAGTLQMAYFEDPRQGLLPTNTGRFIAADPSYVKQGMAQGDQMQQGFVENSNSDGITDMVKLIQTMRAYESNQKSILAQDELNGRLIDGVTAGL